MFFKPIWSFLLLFRSLSLDKWLLSCIMTSSLVPMRIAYGTVLLVIFHRYLIVLIILFEFMEKLLFLSILSISLASCRSVGFHVIGRSTILRNDTIRTTYEVAKPLNQVINVDY